MREPVVAYCLPKNLTLTRPYVCCISSSPVFLSLSLFPVVNWHYVYPSLELLDMVLAPRRGEYGEWGRQLEADYGAERQRPGWSGSLETFAVPTCPPVPGKATLLPSGLLPVFLLDKGSP